MRDFVAFGKYLLGSLLFLRAVFLCMLLLLVLCAVVIRHVEGLPFGEAVYFTLITGLTVGYGDITPATAAGRVFSVLAGVIGLIVFGLVIAVATHALGLAAKEKRDRGKPD